MTSDLRPFAPARDLLGMLRENGGVDRQRLPILAALLGRYALSEPLRQFEERRLAQAIAKHVLTEPPIFVLGFWRSGTTWLQTLLSEDPRFSSSTIFRSLFSDIFSSSESWLKPALQRTSKALDLPHAIQRTRMDFDLPAEADVGLCSSFSPYSYTWGHVFPRRFEHWLDRTVLNPTPADGLALMDDYDRLLRKLSLHSGGKRQVVKTPGDTGRVELLLDRYPQARFIYIHRDPFEVFHSNLYLWSVILREVSLQTLDEHDVTELVIDTYKRVIRNYLRAREVIPTSQLTELRFEDLRREPLPTLARVYEHLGLGALPQAELSEFLARQQPYRQRSYETPPALAERLRDEWAFSFESWNRSPHS